MRNKEKTGLDFLIDKITNSIENAVTGDSFQTEVSILSNADFKTISEKKLWLFDWKTEHRNPKTEVFKLTIIHNPKIIQGLISIEDRMTMSLCTLSKVQNSIKAKTKCILVYPAI